MRIGGGIEKPYHNPEEWYQLVSQLGYRAVLSPVDHTASAEEKRAYLACVKEHDLVIGEVGAWCNPLSKDPSERKKAITYCQQRYDAKRGRDRWLPSSRPRNMLVGN